MTGINTIEDQIALQEDIDKLSNWSEKWALNFHPKKCKAMRIGNKVSTEERYKYILNNSVIDYTENEIDLGVNIDSDLKFDKHINNKVTKANKIMGIIRRSFTHRDKPTFCKLFKAMVRPHIEYANPVWHPRLKKLKTLIENVQRRATKQLDCCKGMDYITRLKFLNLPCLAYRKIRGDMIEAYKITLGKYDIQITPPINMHTSKITRGNCKRMRKTVNRSSRNVRKLGFSNISRQLMERAAGFSRKRTISKQFRIKTG